MAGVQARLRSQIREVDALARDWYENRLPDLYLDGARRVKPNFVLTNADMATIGKIQDEGLLRIQVSNRLAAQDVSRWSQAAKTSPKGQQKVRGIVTKDGRRYTPDRYADLVTIADANRTLNIGSIVAADRSGRGLVIVHDGKDCGLTEHRDPHKADGLILTIDEALAHPIAHPYCERGFDVAPKGSRRTKSKAKVAAQVAGAVVVAGGVSAVAGAVVSKITPTIQRRLTEFVAKASPEFQRYQARVLIEAKKLHQLPDAVTAAVDAEMDDFLESGAQVSDRTRQLLGLNVSAPLQVVGDEYSSILDFQRLKFMAQEELDLSNSAGGHVISLFNSGVVDNIGLDMPRIFGSKRSFGAHYVGRAGRASGRIGRDLSGSFSKGVGKGFRFGAIKKSLEGGTSKFVSFSPGQLFRYRVSRVKYGFAQRFVMNPNGMLRAGFGIDPRTGYIIPNLRFLPPGPVRIFTEVNRSRGSRVTGDILLTEIQKILAGNIGDRKLLSQSAKDVVRIGTRESVGKKVRLLTVKDFAPGSIKDLLFVPDSVPGFTAGEGVIRRGRIPNALSVVVDGRRKAVDLLIRNGKFVLEHAEGKGRITSVSTTVRVIMTKNAKFNIRTNLNLRALELQNLTDVRHLKLRDLQKIDLRRDFKIRSLSTELRFFGYTPFQISKVLRMPWDDFMRLYRDGRRALDFGFRRTALSFMATTGLFADLPAAAIQQLLNTGQEWAINAAKRALETMRREIHDSPLDFVLRRGDISKVSDPWEIKYKRPSEEDLAAMRQAAKESVAERRAKLKLVPKDPDVHKIISDDSVLGREINELFKIVSLHPDEIAEIFDVEAEQAKEMWHSAHAALKVLEDEGGEEFKLFNIPDQLHGYYNLDAPIHADKYTLSEEFLNVAGERVQEDFSAAMEAFYDYFPATQAVDITVEPLVLPETLKSPHLAEFIPRLTKLKFMDRMRAGGFDDFADFVRDSKRGVMGINQRVMARWESGQIVDLNELRSVITQFSATTLGKNHYIKTILHEMGHAALDSLQEQVDGLISQLKILQRLRDEGLIQIMPNASNTVDEAIIAGFGSVAAADVNWVVDQVLKVNFETLVDELSEYATTNWHEFIAESLMEYIMSPNPRPIAKVVGEMMRDFLS